MGDKPGDIESTARAEAETVFKSYPELFLPELQRMARAKQVAVGMDPYMSRLAGGSCTFKVEADSGQWPPNSNPFKVMDAQSLRPDKSRIWLTFRNDTQYPQDGFVTFRVLIENGKVQRIDKLDVIRNCKDARDK